MAENKKSFILYADLIHTIQKLPEDKAGKLFLTILEYVNDKNPVINDLLVEIAFEPIKLQLKRDLVVWENKVHGKSEGGKLGNLKRWHKDLYKQVINNQITIEEALELSHSDQQRSHTITEIADTVTVTVTDNVNVNVKETDIITKKVNSIEGRKLKFASTLKPYLETYGRELLKEFYDYWTEPNKSNTKFRMELEKTWSLSRRLETWAKNDKGFKSTQKSETKQITYKEFK
jgi:hypothetical protein